MSRLGARLAAGPRALAVRTPLLAVIGVIALMLVVGVALSAITSGRVDSLEQARVNATVAAKGDLVALLSYDYQTVESDLPAAGDRLTGQFKDEFAALISKVVVPDAKAQRTSTSATVVDSGVESSGTDQVVLLMFVNQTTRSQQRPTPLISGSRVRVTMQRAAGRWLCAGIVPI